MSAFERWQFIWQDSHLLLQHVGESGAAMLLITTTDLHIWAVEWPLVGLWVFFFVFCCRNVRGQTLGHCENIVLCVGLIDSRPKQAPGK